MAKASVKLICQKCGKEFIVTKRNFSNRNAADNWQDWALDHIELCPDCENEEYKAKRDEESKLIGLHIVKMHYSIYKKHYSTCEKSPHSYNEKDKTIEVYLDDVQLKEFEEKYKE